ncbi:MAG: hypothetical protein EXS25_07350 [Pedosphaera sp.]|nr:hypothetical protein [Pedosphaera sp.]
MMLISLGWLQATEGRVIKVLPHLIDSAGRHTLSPSLYERDAYQSLLRSDPTRVRSLRFDVLWKISKPVPPKLTLRIEMRGGSDTKPQVIDRSVKRGFFGRRWSHVQLSEADYKALGKLAGWRVSLVTEASEVASMSSFLW